MSVKMTGPTGFWATYGGVKARRGGFPTANLNHAPLGCEGAVTDDLGLMLLRRIAGH